MRLSFEAVSYAIDGAEIIRGLDFDCPDGSFVGLLGPNGSGKSTALKTAYRALKPSSGVVRLDGQDLLTDLTPRESARRLAALAQEQTHSFDFTVVEVVKTGRTPHQEMLSRESEEDRAAVSAALETVGMSHHAQRPFSPLSGGEKQRVLLARALAQQPKILVLDEPTNHLDVCTQLDLLELVRSLGVTVVAALHDLNLAAAFCDRLVVLRDGIVVASGEPEAVLTPDIIAEHFGVRAHVSRHPATGALHLAFSRLDQAPDSHRTPTTTQEGSPR